jgi:hypothetical protein
MKHCMTIHSYKEDGGIMRPSTPTPDKHWTGMLAGPYIDAGYVQVCYPQDRQYPSIELCSKFAKEDKEGFIRVAQFAKSNGLIIEVVRKECVKCESKLSECPSPYKEK